MRKWMAFGIEFSISILQIAFFNFQWEVEGWGKLKQAIGK
jgi:hypothetical protein